MRILSLCPPRVVLRLVCIPLIRWGDVRGGRERKFDESPVHRLDPTSNRHLARLSFPASPPSLDNFSTQPLHITHLTATMSSSTAPTSSVHISGLSPSTTQDHLTQFFSFCGSIDSIAIEGTTATVHFKKVRSRFCQEGSLVDHDDEGEGAGAGAGGVGRGEAALREEPQETHTSRLELTRTSVHRSPRQQRRLCSSTAVTSTVPKSRSPRTTSKPPRSLPPSLSTPRRTQRRKATILSRRVRFYPFLSPFLPFADFFSTFVRAQTSLTRPSSQSTSLTATKSATRRSPRLSRLTRATVSRTASFRSSTR